MTWQSAAACAQIPPARADRLFFGNDSGGLAEGRALCRQSCPVRLECQALADKLEVGFRGNRAHAAGIWGGEFVTERITRRNRALEQAS